MCNSGGVYRCLELTMGVYSVQDRCRKLPRLANAQ